MADDATNSDPADPSPRSGPLPLSVAIVCKNSAATIGRTLDSVAGLAAEVVAVDSGSTDATLDLLARHGARVIRSTWLGHVRTKQLALEACAQPWVLALDSDESPEPDQRRGIAAALKADDPAIAGYRVNRKVFYAGRFLAHAYQPEWRLRLVRRGAAAWRGIDPHDELALLDPRARAADLPGDLRHDSIASIAEFLGKQVAHGQTSARALHALGRRGSLLRLATSPPGAFFKQLVIKRGLLDGWRGWLAASAAATAALSKHAALVELSRAGARPAGQPTARGPEGSAPTNDGA